MFNCPKPPDGELRQVYPQAANDMPDKKTVCHIVCYSLMDKPIEFSLKFFSGGGRSGQTYSENRRKIIFVWGCPLGAFFNCDFAPIFSLMSRARQAGYNYLLKASESPLRFDRSRGGRKKQKPPAPQYSNVNGKVSDRSVSKGS